MGKDCFSFTLNIVWTRFTRYTHFYLPGLSLEAEAQQHNRFGKGIPFTWWVAVKKKKIRPKRKVEYILKSNKASVICEDRALVVITEPVYFDSVTLL